MNGLQSVYIVGFDDEVVKVGRSWTPRDRINGLTSEARSRGAERVAYVYRPIENAEYIERQMIQIGHDNYQHAWGVEYFFGDFSSFLARVERDWMLEEIEHRYGNAASFRREDGAFTGQPWRNPQFRYSRPAGRFNPSLPERLSASTEKTP